MIIMNPNGSTTDLSAETPVTMSKNPGFGDELSRNPFNVAPTVGSPMPFTGGYKSGALRTKNALPTRSGVIK